MIKSTLKIARYCPLVIQGFTNFLGLFQVMTWQTSVYLDLIVGFQMLGVLLLVDVKYTLTFVT